MSNRYCNMSEENKKKLKEYQKRYCDANKRMLDYMHNRLLILLISFLISLCNTVLAQ